MVTCYPVANKLKSLNICQAFAKGCGGKVVQGAASLLYGPSFFYGVDESNMHLWNAAKLDIRRDFYYCDNSYFDSSRQQYFRITANRVQHAGTGFTDGVRFESLGIRLDPWKEPGRHIVVCPQSLSFMRDIAGYVRDWTADTLEALGKVTTRDVRVRPWSADKAKLAVTLSDDLKGAYALVTWSSAAAVSAIVSGVPAVVTGQCAAAPVAATRIEQIEFAPRPPREIWAGVLADNQFTLEEMRSGYAWEKVQNG